jgi:hypothetical protein
LNPAAQGRIRKNNKFIQDETQGKTDHKSNNESSNMSPDGNIADNDWLLFEYKLIG